MAMKSLLVPAEPHERSVKLGGMIHGHQHSKCHTVSSDDKWHYQGVERFWGGLPLQSLPDCVSQACLAAALVLGVQAQCQVVLRKRLFDSASYVQNLQSSQENSACPADVRKVHCPGHAHRAALPNRLADLECRLGCCRKAS